jgi:hypothetical protein
MSTLLQMNLKTDNPEPSEFLEETNTSTSSLFELHLHPHPTKLKSSFQNKMSTRTWFMFFSKREKTLPMSRFDDQLPKPHKNQKFISSDMEDNKLKDILVGLVDHLDLHLVDPLVVDLSEEEALLQAVNMDFKKHFKISIFNSSIIYYIYFLSYKMIRL